MGSVLSTIWNAVGPHLIELIVVGGLAYVNRRWAQGERGKKIVEMARQAYHVGEVLGVNEKVASALKNNGTLVHFKQLAEAHGVKLTEAEEKAAQLVWKSMAAEDKMTRKPNLGPGFVEVDRRAKEREDASKR